MNKIIAFDREHLRQLITEHTRAFGNHCDLNHIDISHIRAMYDLFYESDFNGDISEWDVSQVTNMNSMFEGSKFNGDISKWDVSNVVGMSLMFERSTFNGDISKWNTAHVQNMSGMFHMSKFNGDISKWDVSNVRDMSYLFYDSPFSGDITHWNIKSDCLVLKAFNTLNISPLGLACEPPISEKLLELLPSYETRKALLKSLHIEGIQLGEMLYNSIKVLPQIQVHYDNFSSI